MRRMVTGLLCIAACHGEAAVEKGPALSQGAVRFETARGPWIVRVEIASDDASRTRGLMYRRSLEPDRGMIFVFPTTEDHTFWMHNTLIALDMVFLDESRSVIGVVASASPPPRVVGEHEAHSHARLRPALPRLLGGKGPDDLALHQQRFGPRGQREQELAAGPDLLGARGLDEGPTLGDVLRIVREERVHALVVDAQPQGRARVPTLVLRRRHRRSI